MGDYTTWRERRDIKYVIFERLPTIAIAMLCSTTQDTNLSFSRLAGKRYRCNPKVDSGKTRAKKGAYICLYFARGKCIQGPDCTFLHRTPREEDEARIGLSVDIFGRERHRTHRDDMSGTGSFEINNKTLYIGGLKMQPDEDLEEVIRKEFGEFGEVDLINVIKSKAIAFVRFKLRVCAEFAREAMSDQPLGKTDIVNVRWANADPNPVAQERDELALLVEASKKIQKTYEELYDYDDQLAKGYYPSTDHQYSKEQWDQWKAYYEYYGYEMPSYEEYEATAKKQKTGEEVAE